MTIPEQIRTLEELAAVDAVIRSLDDQIKLERGGLGDLKGKLKTIEDKLNTDRTTAAANEKMRGELHQDIRTMNGQIEHSRDKLARSRTERETNAVTREMEELRKLLKDRDTEMDRLAAEAEMLRGRIADAEGEVATLQGQLQSTEGDINSKLGQLESERAARATEREVVVKRLPPVLYRRYEQIRLKRGVALASTTDGTCRACHMALPPQLFHRLRREPVIEQCQSCNRLIYFLAPKAGDAPSPT